MNAASAKLMSDSRWANVKFLVKATEHEQFFLWKEHSKQYSPEDKGIDWVSQGESKALTIDMVDGKPISICITFVKMNDVQIAFYDSLSRLVDWDVITTFMKEVFKQKWNGDKPAVCGVSNFKDCLRYVLVEKSREVKTDKEKEKVSG